MDENEFEPRLGRGRAEGSKRSRKFLGDVVRAAARHGLPKRGTRPRFTGSRLGRGGAAARILLVPDRYAGLRARRASVRTRIVRLGSWEIAAARSHLRYLQRDGVGREGEKGRLYSAIEDEADAKSFIARSKEDRHQFRIIASAEDGVEYDDLRPLIRRFMARMEEDLGARLEWVAANHADTLKPHTHIVLRGREDDGANLIIAPAYIYHGMRERLVELLSIDLGPKTDFEIQRRLGLDVSAERLTSIDERLLQSMDENRLVRVVGRDMFDHSIQVGRLRKLEALGVAEPVAGGRWRLDEELEPLLHTLGERADNIDTLRRALSAAGVDRAPCDQLIFDPDRSRSILGKLVSRGFIDEKLGREYLVVDAIDGRSHHVEIAKGDAREPLPSNAIVRISSSFKALKVELLSAFPLEQLVGHDGATWLDGELVSPGDPPRDSGFGREVRSALALRRAWLVDRGLASLKGKEMIFPPTMIEELRKRELARLNAAISKETGLHFAAPDPGIPIEGILRRRIDFPSGSFAMIDDGQSFSLVPWRPDLGRALGQTVRGSVRADARISWTIGRNRGLEIS